MRPALVRQRTVWLPTLAGWAVIALALLAGAAAAVRALPRFLAVDAPVGRGLLVVEGWLPASALRAAAAELRRGRYDGLVVTGGPLLEPEWSAPYRTYAERAAAYLRAGDLGGREVVAVPAPAVDRERTYESALAVRRWLEASGRRVDAVDVFTYGPHARRSRHLYRLALGTGVSVGTRAVPPAEYDLDHWWRKSRGARDVIGEAVGYLWVSCCFSPRPAP